MAAAVDVWKHNLLEQLEKISDLRPSFPIVALDTEFSGILRSTPHHFDEEERYYDLKYNVDNLNMIQLGISLFDAAGNRGGVWQINFSDCDPDIDPSSPASVRGSGIDLKKNQRDGVPSLLCAPLLRERLFSYGGEFVTFHGLYDVGYLVKMFTGGRPLPETLEEFITEATIIFGGRLFDLKYIARFCRGLLGGKLSLMRLAKFLDVKVEGVAHQGGFDSLVTGLCFHEMRKRWAIGDEEEVSMILYGLEVACCESKDDTSSVDPPSWCPPASPTRFTVPLPTMRAPCAFPSQHSGSGWDAPWCPPASPTMRAPCAFPSQHSGSDWDGGSSLLPPAAPYVVWVPALIPHPFHHVSVPSSIYF